MNNQAEINLKLQVKADIQAQPFRSQTYFSSFIDVQSRSEEIVLLSKGVAFEDLLSLTFGMSLKWLRSKSL